MNIELITVETSFGLLSGDIYHASKEKVSNVLCVHGGGLRGRSGFISIRKALATQGVTTYAFDFVGHGDTKGDKAFSSLEKKVEQVLEIIKRVAFKYPITVIASSMGGYIALKAGESCEIDNLILIAPAVYTKDAFSIPFGDDFSSIIRVPFSWEKTDAFEVVSFFTGKLLLLEAEKDQVIPKDVVRRIYDSAHVSRRKKYCTFKGATHPLTDWLSCHPEDFKVAIAEIVNSFDV